MSIHDRILKKAAGRFTAMGMARRADLALIDHAPLGDGKRSVHVLLAHSPELGPPTGLEVQDFFVATFGERVRANLSTLRTHAEESAVSVVAAIPPAVQPIEFANTLTRVNPLQYIDADTNEIWDVVNNEEGRKYMLRHSDENLSDIVEQRKASVKRWMPKLATLKVSFVACDKGDHVQFYDNGILAQGEVKSCGERVTISTTGGGTTTVGREAVLKIVQKAPQAMSDEKNELRDYFEKAYGDKSFADELTRTTVQEQSGGKTGV